MDLGFYYDNFKVIHTYIGKYSQDILELLHVAYVTIMKNAYTGQLIHWCALKQFFLMSIGVF